MSITEARLDGKLAIVTGANSGLGLETAIGLARHGAKVILAVRNPARGEAALIRLRGIVPGAQAECAALDLASMDSVAAFAAQLRDSVQAVDILVNNAGLMSPAQRQETADGFELTLGTNHLGHVALTARLFPLLTAAVGGGVIVPVASVAARRGHIDFQDLQSRHRYQPMAVYSQSKLANLLFALEFSRRVQAEGWPLHVRVAHPGWSTTEIIDNAFGRRGGAIVRIQGRVANLAFRWLGQSAADGALPILHAAASSRAQDGCYYGPSGQAERRGPVGLAVVPPSARDPEVARRLWEVSERLVGLRIGG